MQTKDRIFSANNRLDISKIVYFRDRFEFFTKSSKMAQVTWWLLRGWRDGVSDDPRMILRKTFFKILVGGNVLCSWVHFKYLQFSSDQKTKFWRSEEDFQFIKNIWLITKFRPQYTVRWCPLHFVFRPFLTVPEVFTVNMVFAVVPLKNCIFQTRVFRR